MEIAILKYMRRKLFYIFILIVVFVFILDYLNVDLSFKRDDILKYADEDHEYTLEIVRYKKSSEKLSLTCKVLKVDELDSNLKGRVLINIYNNDINNDILFSTFKFNGVLSYPNTRRNPHTFDYKKYLLGKGIYLTSSSKVIDISSYECNRFKKVIRFLDNKKYEFIDYFSDSNKGIVLGLLFGDSSLIDDDVYDNFRSNGTSHILAVSGLHIGIIYNILEKILKKRSEHFELIVAVFLSIYGFLCMWSVSITRAIFMIYIKLISYKFDLRYDTLNALSLVGIIQILYNPYVVFQNSFQISYLAVISIAVISPIFRNKSIFSTSLSVSIGTIGYQAYVFNFITPLSILINIPILFITSYLVSISITFYIIFVLIGSFVIPYKVLDYIFYILVNFNNFTAMNEKFAFDISSKVSIIFIIISIVIFFNCSEHIKILKLRNNKKKIQNITKIIVIFSILFVVCTYNPITYDDIVFIDVGQGDSIHIKGKDYDILIDGGGSVSYNIGKNTLKPYLLKNGTSNIDLAIATHLHTDHFKGLLELDDCFKINNVITDIYKNDEIRIGDDLIISCLWPVDENSSKDDNKNCSVFLVRYKGIKILITGDLDEDGEKLILNAYGKDYLKCDILKVGHHGSNTSSSEEFLKAVSPRYAVIQVGKNNYGHPSEETLYKLDKIGAIILRNDLNGAIGFRFKGNDIKYHLMIENGLR